MKEKFLIQFAHMMVSFSGIGKELRQAKKRIALLEREYSNVQSIARKSIAISKGLQEENKQLWKLKEIK